MSKSAPSHLYANTSRLKWWLALFVFSLLIPLAILVRQTFSQLQWESFQQNRIQAEALFKRVEQRLGTIIFQEEARSIGEYRFLSASGNIENSYVQRSALSQYPFTQDIPGLVGYFQIDGSNRFSSPLLPDTKAQALSYGLTSSEYIARAEARDSVFDVLRLNQLVSRRTTAPELVNQLAEEEIVFKDELQVDASESVSITASEKSSVAPQAAFDNLPKKKSKSPRKEALGRLEDLELDDQLQNLSLRQEARSFEEEKTRAKKNVVDRTRVLRKEQSVVAESLYNAGARSDSDVPAENAVDRPEIQIKIFESEIEPFQVNLLESGHLVVFRRVWSNGQRLIQGFLIDQSAFFRQIIQAEYVNSALIETSRLVIAHKGDLIDVYSPRNIRSYGISSREDVSGDLLFQMPLLSPFTAFSLVFTVSALPIGAGGTVVLSSTIALALFILVGAWLFYRYALAQSRLMNQQQDFVSSVSHELKTPLTSIRMYGEMLREGWVNEEKRKEYYDFIYYESERLSRLINNVLQLAKLTRNTVEPDLKPHTVNQLADIVKSKLSSQISRSGFELIMHTESDVATKTVDVDEDMFTQIMINLADNAVKYSAKAQTKKIDIKFALMSKNRIKMSVRDYGPGIEPGQLKKIFTLFYRNENELTRETKGTGIGLALVSQYTSLMRGSIDVINTNPGAEVILMLPLTRH